MYWAELRGRLPFGVACGGVTRRLYFVISGQNVAFGELGCCAGSGQHGVGRLLGFEVKVFGDLACLQASTQIGTHLGLICGHLA